MDIMWPYWEEHDPERPWDEDLAAFLASGSYPEEKPRDADLRTECHRHRLKELTDRELVGVAYRIAGLLD